MRKKKIIIIAIVLFLIAIFIVWAYWVDFGKNKKIEYGATFSQKYASELNLDWQQVYLAILDNLGVKHLRLIAHWDLIEPEINNYDFSDLDWQIDQAASRGGQISLVIGHRVPRWPECHWPKWSFELNESQRQQQVLKLLTQLVERYKNNSAIISWQVENEPFLRVFGECPRPNMDFYKEEIELVRGLDSRPIVATESGELSTWLKGGRIADYIGTSVYRITWNRRWGYFTYPFPPSYYYLKTQLIKLSTPVKGVMVSEMQMEPWSGMPILLTPLEEQYYSMNLKQFEKNLNYARRIGLSPVYFWGVEWWYWLKEQGDSSIWQAAEQIW